VRSLHCALCNRQSLAHILGPQSAALHTVCSTLHAIGPLLRPVYLAHFEAHFAANSDKRAASVWREWRPAHWGFGCAKQRPRCSLGAAMCAERAAICLAGGALSSRPVAQLIGRVCLPCLDVYVCHSSQTASCSCSSLSSRPLALWTELVSCFCSLIERQLCHSISGGNVLASCGKNLIHSSRGRPFRLGARK